MQETLCAIFAISLRLDPGLTDAKFIGVGWAGLVGWGPLVAGGCVGGGTWILELVGEGLVVGVLVAVGLIPGVEEGVADGQIFNERRLGRLN